VKISGVLLYTLLAVALGGALYQSVQVHRLEEQLAAAQDTALAGAMALARTETAIAPALASAERDRQLLEQALHERDALQDRFRGLRVGRPVPEPSTVPDTCYELAVTAQRLEATLQVAEQLLEKDDQAIALGIRRGDSLQVVVDSLRPALREAQGRFLQLVEDIPTTLPGPASTGGTRIYLEGEVSPANGGRIAAEAGLSKSVLHGLATAYGGVRTPDVKQLGTEAGGVQLVAGVRISVRL
jgi:hypothetical protein